jgi:hypothetical protein
MAGWRRERLPALPRDAGIDVVPGWICEILSPSTVSVSRLVDGAWSEVAVHGEDERVRLPPFADVEINLGSWWEEPPPI